MDIALTAAVVGLQAVIVVVLLRLHGQHVLFREEVGRRLEGSERALRALIERGPQAGRGDAAGRQPSVPEGLPVGTVAPDFRLPDLAGTQHTLSEFLGSPALLVFFDPACGFCRRMAPDLAKLSEAAPRVVVLSMGDAEENRRLAETNGWRSDVLLQTAREVEGAYRVRGTPSAYLIDAEGKIASRVAAGAPEIFNLLDEATPTAADGDLTAASLEAKARAVAERARAAGLAVRDPEESRIKRSGLAAGTPAPEFSLPDLGGTTRTLSEFRGKRVLLVFSDPQCGPCQFLTPKLEEVHRQNHGSNLEVVMIGRGDAKANQRKASEHGVTFPVVLQKRWEISREYGIFATPVGYLVDEKGVLASDAAVGNDAILRVARDAAG
jgi:peroxiredoxin